MNVLILDEALRKLRRVEATRDQQGYVRRSENCHQLCIQGASLIKVRILFRYSTIEQTSGVCIDFLSLYPKEVEFLFPPLTNLTYNLAQEGEETSRNGLVVIPVRPPLVVEQK